jgi:serine/threonine-protein phosphatase 2A regulatory subunit B
MEELSEVVTGAEFHPHDCNLLMYSSSKGLVRVGDLREQALCDRYAKG